jgi:hypothetical protein
MGFNMMSGRRRVQVTETAMKSTALALRRVRLRDPSVLPERSRRRGGVSRRRVARRARRAA